MKDFIINLQLFAEAGTVVNATGNYVNAYTGETSAFEGKNTLSPGMKTYYDTELLANSEPDMVYAQFGKRQNLPANGGKNVEWRKWNTLPNATALVEGVIPSGEKLGQSVITSPIASFGMYVTVSDELELRYCDDVILGAQTELASSAGNTSDILIRDDLMTNTNVLYCNNIGADGAFVSTPESCGQMENAPLTGDMVNRAFTTLKKAKAPRIDGKYVAVIHPSVAYDLRSCKEWIEAHQYSATTELFNGEIGELHGVRFVESNNAPVLGGEYVNKAGTMTYATFFFGKDSFGIIDPEGGALEMIIKNRGEIGGPLEQFSTIGYKFSTGTKVLYPERLLRVMSTSAYSAVDEAN